MNGDFSFLKGNIYTIILCSLYGKDGANGDKYGYEIAKEIKERTDNKYEIKQPTLYSYLKKLEQQDLIESYWGTESNGGRRRYYKLTPKGRNDCKSFMAEWEYHKSVLSTLVDAPSEPIEISQADVTPLFGEKQRRVKKSAPIRSKELDEQDELSRKLDELIGKPAKEEEFADKSAQQTSLFEAFDYAYQQTEEPEQSSEEIVATVAEEDPDVVEIVEEPVVATAAQSQAQMSDEDILAKFEVNQDDADEFLQKFDERARVVAENFDTTTESNENYQHVLMRMLGDQLDDMREYDSEQSDGAQKYYTDHPVALEDVADGMAKQGIRLRIYNHASANFKSKTLMPNAMVLMKTAWITFAVAFVYFGALLFTSINNGNWQPFLITISVLLLAPIAVTMYALYDPSRKEKPRFMFSRILIATATLAAIVILLSLGISILKDIELSSYTAVSTQILLPTGVAILMPIFVLIYNAFYKKY
ncbi:MAG: DUF1493 family protein [Corallococcus sp.]|nr:DUF1493 family protein [Corallococcus sp.]MCM1359163.1 DUF1493 family protein [Corallococcus sp.]MCM1394553.1 DUF1493 family protein [Corallococcus sp.]